MSDDKKQDEHIQYFVDQVDREGAAIRKVSDGHVLMFRKDFMQKLLDEHPTSDTLCIFLQTPPASEKMN